MASTLAGAAKRRRRALALSGLAALLFWALNDSARAAPTVASVTTAADYQSLTVNFTDAVAGSGVDDDAGKIVLDDVEVVGAGAGLAGVDHAAGSDTVVLRFDGPVQHGATVTVTDLNEGDLTARVPLAPADWSTIQASLRALELPAAEIPIAPYLDRGSDGSPRALDDLLPGTMDTSLDLPAPISITRSATNGSFTVAADGSAVLVTEPLSAQVRLDDSGGLAYNLDLSSHSTVDVAVSLDGTITLDRAGTPVSAALSIGMAASATPTLHGSVGIVEASVLSTVVLDASVTFDLDDTTDDVPTITTASATLGDVTIEGLGAGGSDIVAAGVSLLEIGWPSLPGVDAGGERVETGVATDGGWAAAGLQRLANADLGDLIGAPGGVAAWLGAAQTLGRLSTPLPVVGTPLGETLGVAQSLAAVHDQVAAAAAVSAGPLAPPGPTPALSGDLCTDLEASALQSAKIEEATASLGGSPSVEQIRAELDNVTVDDAQIMADFADFCGYLFGAVTLDLGQGTIESAVAVPGAAFNFSGGQAPSLDLAYGDAGLTGLGVRLDGGSWTGTSNPALDFTLGVKLDSDTDLLGHGLATDLDSAGPAEPPVPPDEDDVTAAYRVYVPAGQQIATSTATVAGTGLSGVAQIGFLDLALTGDLSIAPTVSLTAADPASGFGDGKADLLELLDSAVVEADGTTDIASALAVTLGGDDVDIHFQLANSVLDTTADLDVAGDLNGLLLGQLEFREVAVGGPLDVAADTLAIGATLGDTLDVAAMSPTEVVALVADVIDRIAQSAAVSAGDERIPIIDVSLNEVAGLTSALAGVSEIIRERLPTTVSDLETMVNDALAANGMGAAEVGFVASGPSGDPELTISLDAGLSAAASYPISFELPDAGTGEIFTVAPADGGARLDAAVRIDFVPEVGVRFNDSIPVSDALFVRDLAARFDFLLSGTAEGSVAFGPVEASLAGDVTIGDGALDSGGFTASLTTGGQPTVPVSDLADGTADFGLAGAVGVSASVNLEIPTFAGAITGTIGIAGQVPGGVTFEAPQLNFPDLRSYFSSLRPNLRTLADGAIETSRFIARGADEVGDVARQIPIAGHDVAAQFEDASAILDDVAEEIEAVVDLLDSEDGDAASLLEAELNNLFTDLGCTLCQVEARWTPEGTSSILDATGIEVLLTIAGETAASASTSAGFGLEPLLKMDLDVTGASARIGFAASIGLGVDIEQGFYLFPGIDPDTEDGVGNLFELYADLDLASDLALTIAGAEATAAGSELSVGGGLSDGTAGGLKIEMPDQLLISDLVNRSRKLSDVLVPSLDASISADLPVALGIEVVAGQPFEVSLPFDFDWQFSDTLEPDIDTATFAIVDAELDVGSLATLVGDVLEDFNRSYNPLEIDQVKVTLDTEVPLINMKVRDALLAACDATGSSGCDVFRVLTGLPALADQIRGLAGDALPLGSFQILPAPPAGTSRYTPPGAAAPAPEPGPGQTPPAAPPGSGAAGLNAEIMSRTAGYLSLPIVEDLPAVLAIVLGGELGEEVDIVRFEIPAGSPAILGQSFALKQTLAELDVGFLEGDLSVKLNGGIGLNLGGGFGFSTRAIANGNFLDGIFLIDGQGSEIALGAQVNAEVNGRFAVGGDLEIATVRFRGAGRFAALGGVDLFDESPVLVGRGGGDGRLFFDEIAAITDAYAPPIPSLPASSALCMFQLRTTGDWSLSFSGKAKVLGITVFNESFSDGGTLWDETISCALRPRIARVENRQLILHAGPNASDRFDSQGDVAERFRITRQGSNALVEWLGTPAKASLSFPLSSFDTIVAAMGNENDTLEVDDGIVQPVIARGGGGDDELDGGGGDDDLGGGPGTDELDGGGGDDRLRGDGDADDLAGGPGDDDIDGGAGGDTVAVAGAFGSDVVSDSGSTSDVDTVDLSAVGETLVGGTAFGEATIDAGGSRITYPSAAIERVVGGSAGDRFTFKDREPDGFEFDGGDGADTVTFLSGRRDRQVSVHDSGTEGSDTVTVLGGAGRDAFLLRASSTALGQTAANGFVARLSDGVADRYDYDDTIENLNVDGGLGADEFTLDDNAAATNIVGGQGEDVIQVGQVYGLADCEPNGSLEALCSPTDADSFRGGADDRFATTVITRGHLSNGATHDVVIDGGDQNDSITIFANNAPVEANGGEGNDRFVARAFIVSASVQLNGEGGIDDFTYAVNDEISIDGGPGVDTFTIVGAEADDGFIVDVDESGMPAIQVCELDGTTGLPDPAGVCAISATVDAVEVFSVLGLEGDDVFWIRASQAASLVEMSGGDGSDRFLIGDGTLAEIDGPLVALGDDAGAVPSIPDPVVLPDEDATAGFPPAATGGSDVGDTLEIDATTDGANLTGEVTDTAIRGLGMAGGPFTVGTGESALVVGEVLAFDSLEFQTLALGPGGDLVTVTGTHAGNTVCDGAACPLHILTNGGADTVDIKAIAGETSIDLGEGNDLTTAGEPSVTGDTLDGIDAGLTVTGGPGTDTLDLDDSNDGPSRIDVDAGLITRAGLDPAGVAHGGVETVHARLGPLSDVVNIRGTGADAITEVHGNDGSDRFFVSSTAAFDVADPTDEHLSGDLDGIAGALVTHGDAGDGNLLRISDREAGAGDGAAFYDGTVLDGLAPATISHDVTGAFGGGITVWTSEHDDTLTVTGSDLSTTAGTRTLTTFNTGDGADTLTLSLSAGGHGPFVANTEEGDDTVAGQASSLDLLVFGGLGADLLTTGSGHDTVFGDIGSARTAEGGTVTGGGGPGDVTDGGVQAIDQLASGTGGDGDEIDAGAGDDVAIGGDGADDIDGGDHDDIVIGGHLRAGGSDTGDSLAGGPGEDVMAGDNASFDAGAAPVVLRAFDLETTSFPLLASLGGGDTIAGGPDDDLIVGQHGDDELSGDGGDDTIEGNAGDDEISGGEGQDDLTGGGSALDGVIDGERVWTDSGTGLADGSDTIDGGAGADVILGDNGWIVRTVDAGGSPVTLADQFGSHNPELDGMVVRDARVSDGIDPDGSYGSDLLRGGDGPDELHGQLDTSRSTTGGNVIDGDELDGGAGPDVLVGDLASIVTVLEDGSRTEEISDRSPFLSATLHQAGTLTREVTLMVHHDGDHVDEGDGSDLAQTGAEGDDLLLGGDDADVLHGGGGDDVANGGGGSDTVFGGDGADAAWGGPGDDSLFGGHDEDSLDVAPRDFTTRARGETLGPDPAIWFEAAPSFEALSGLDLAYGGWNTDDMQADQQSNGPEPGDRLIDWNGAYNRYLGCGGGGGAGSFLRASSPSIRAFVSDLARGRGAVGASGYRELGIVEIEHGSLNSGSVGGGGHIACP